jgi:hypothetical protein
VTPRHYRVEILDTEEGAWETFYAGYDKPEALNAFEYMLTTTEPTSVLLTVSI